MEKSKWKLDSNHSIVERPNENINNNADTVPQQQAEVDVEVKNVITDDMVLAQLTLNIQLDLNQNHPLLLDHQAQNKFILDNVMNQLSVVNFPTLQNLDSSQNQYVPGQSDKQSNQKSQSSFAREQSIKNSIEQTSDNQDDYDNDSSSQKSSIRGKQPSYNKQAITRDGSFIINNRQNGLANHGNGHNYGYNFHDNDDYSDDQNSRTETSDIDGSTIDTNNKDKRPPNQGFYKPQPTQKQNYHRNDGMNPNQKQANFGGQTRQVIHTIPPQQVNSDSDNFASNENSSYNIHKKNSPKVQPNATNSKVTDESSSFDNSIHHRNAKKSLDEESHLTNDDDSSQSGKASYAQSKNPKKSIPDTRDSFRLNKANNQPIISNQKVISKGNDNTLSSKTNPKEDPNVTRLTNFVGEPLKVRYDIHNFFDKGDLHESIDLGKNESLYYKQTKHTKNNDKYHNLSVGVIRERRKDVNNLDTEIIVRCSELESARGTQSQSSEQSIQNPKNKTVDATLILPQKQGKGELKFNALDNPALQITFGASRQVKKTNQINDKQS